MRGEYSPTKTLKKNLNIHRTEFIQIMPKKATVVAETSTLNQKVVFLMNFK